MQVLKRAATVAPERLKQVTRIREAAGTPGLALSASSVKRKGFLGVWGFVGGYLEGRPWLLSQRAYFYL